uniref:V-set and transmembrane domain containing 4 n=1 Tax=Molossus molossus TaxID=27622 RepID=A0A7J8DRW1_MOLMO|nr:V-set and transmembrane domain containing 4 [Molossus molossus]
MPSEQLWGDCHQRDQPGPTAAQEGQEAKGEGGRPSRCPCQSSHRRLVPQTEAAETAEESRPAADHRGEPDLRGAGADQSPAGRQGRAHQHRLRPDPVRGERAVAPPLPALFNSAVPLFMNPRRQSPYFCIFTRAFCVVGTPLLGPPGAFRGVAALSSEGEGPGPGQVWGTVPLGLSPEA